MKVAEQLIEPSFLKANRICQEEWQASSIDWQTLHQSGLNHEREYRTIKRKPQKCTHALSNDANRYILFAGG